MPTYRFAWRGHSDMVISDMCGVAVTSTTPPSPPITRDITVDSANDLPLLQSGMAMIDWEYIEEVVGP